MSPLPMLMPIEWRSPFRVTTVAILFWLLAFDCSLAETTSRFERGITGVRTFRYEGPPLRAKTQRDTTTALVVRLHRGQAADEYTVRFIGNVPGQYDLRDWLEHTSGVPVNTLSPLPIEIVSTLPKDERSDLFETDGFQPHISGGYRVALVLTVLAWLAIPAAVVLRKMMTPKPVEALVPEATTVPIIDQLRPLIAAAYRDELSTGDKARLELLLLHYWREKEQMPQLDMASSIEQLRAHQEAGPMIAAVERWLHQDNTSTQSHSLEHVLDLLKSMYRPEPSVSQSSVSDSSVSKLSVSEVSRPHSTSNDHAGSNLT